MRARTLATRTFRTGLIAALLAALLPVASAAQEIGESEESETSPGEVNETVVEDAGGTVRRLARPLQLPDDAYGPAFAIWPEERLGYHFVSTPPPRRVGLVALDLDTSKEVVRRDTFVPDTANATDEPEPEWLTVDHARGRVVFATPVSPNERTFPDQQAEGTSKLRTAPQIAVLDAKTLETVTVMDFAPISVDGRPILINVLAMHIVSPEADAGDKLLVLVEETAQDGALFEQIDQNTNRVFAVQFDISARRQEWAVPLDACRGTNKQAGNNNAAANHTKNRNTIFRTSTGGQDYIYASCHAQGSAFPARIVRLPLDQDGGPAFLPVQPGDPVAAVVSGGDIGPDDLVVQRATQQVFPGPALAGSVYGDPDGQRIYVQSIDGSPPSEVWWVFDVAQSEWVGTVGIGKRWRADESTNGLDLSTGRLYVMAPTTTPQTTNETAKAGGFFMADARRTPVAQAIRFADFASLAHVDAGLTEQKGDNNVPIVVDPGDDDRPRRIYFRSGSATEQLTTHTAPDFYYVFEDTVPVSEDLPEEDFEGQTDDVAEDPATTRVNYAGSARGYGFRALLVGGVEGVFRLGPLDAPDAKRRAIGIADGLVHNTAPGFGLDTSPLPKAEGTDPCSHLNRDVSFAFVGPGQSAVLDGSGGRATAEPFVLDSTTRAQSEVPYSSCAPLDWTELWNALPFTRPPVPEPQVPWLFGDGAASCSAASDGDPDRRSVRDPTIGAFTATVQCAGDVIRGSSEARTVGADDVSVAHASSTFEVGRGDGLFARVESVARGISIAGIVRIDAVRAVAESWANGRAQPDDISEDPNCARTRTAGTCYTRVLQGVHTPTFSCQACYDQAAAVGAIQRALGDSWRVRLREPDEFLRQGTENGYIAAIQKRPYEVFSDLTLNNDLIRFTVPALEIVRFSDGRTRGRQVFQFAGTEIATAYGIECLFEVVDGECRSNPGLLTIALTDLDSAPLAGGVFEVYRDAETALPDPLDELLDACEPSPSESPTDEASPSESPTDEPSPSESPTDKPSPTESPTDEPSPTESPTDEPSPTESPTESSSEDPCEEPSPSPSGTEEPSSSESPTDEPSPTESPTDGASPTESPSDDPSPSESPTDGTSPTEASTDEAATETGTDEEALDPVDSLPEPVTALLDPLADELVAVCRTADDGVGDCSLELPPGNYIIHQALAPAGFMAGPDFAVQLFEGDELTVTFTNISALGAVEITLLDAGGAPLADGRFELYVDDGDGVVTPAGPSDGPSGEQSPAPLPDPTDTLVPTPGPTATDAPAVTDRLLLSCVTGADGRCSFLELPLGPLGQQSFVVHQAAAPPGFFAAPDVSLTLLAGQRYDITFTNARDAGGRIEISLSDPAGSPLPGGSFTVYRDVDEDGALGESDVPYASCSTGGDGRCAFPGLDADPSTVSHLALDPSGLAIDVPLGAYVIHQTAAPDGFEPAADIAFTFTDPGQVASVGIVNASGGRVGPGLSMGGFTSPLVEGPFPYDPGVPAPQVAEGTIFPQQGLGLLQAPAQLFRLAIRNPKEAAAFGTLWLLFGAALGAVRRRMLLIELLGP